MLCRNPELLVEARQEAVQDRISLVDGGDAARRSSVTSRSWNVPAVRSTRPFACGDLANIWRIPNSSMARANWVGPAGFWRGSPVCLKTA